VIRAATQLAPPDEEVHAASAADGDMVARPLTPSEPRGGGAVGAGLGARLGRFHGRAARWLPALIAAGTASVAITVLHRELRTYHYHDITRSAAAVPGWRIAAALLLTALDFSILMGYDALALRYVRRRLPLRCVALASTLGYAFSHTLSFTALTGGSIRYRFWSAWGLSAPEIARGVGFILLTNAVGIVTTCGVALALGAGLLPHPLGLPATAPRAVGFGLLVLVAMYLAANVAMRHPFRVRGWQVAMPGPALAVGQLAVAAADWMLAGAVLYVLLPRADGLTFPVFLGGFLLAQWAGILSQVPGGFGVFDAAIVLLVRQYIPAGGALGALILYRAIYYLTPFSAATLTLGAYEVGQRRAGVSRAVGAARRWLSAVAPDVLSAATFLAGVVLLASGATPAVHSRLAWLDTILPLGVMEVSHFVGSLAGVGLLILAYALRRRLDVAYHLTIIALITGITASLLKGGDWEEALILAGVLAVLVPSRQHFYRRAALTSELWSPGWAVAVLLVVAGCVWLGLFSYKRVAYSDDLWWRFTLRGDAPRFLRATVGAVGFIVAAAVSRLLRPASPARPSATPEELDRAARIAHQSGRVDAYLATLGDKALLFGETGGLLMYAVSGRSCVALGDPVGAPDERAELAWRFKEMADRHGCRTVFYEVGSESLGLYIDLGLMLFKLGEEARVPLSGFTLDGGSRRWMRRTLRDVERAGCVFELVPAEQVGDMLPELERVSNEWLAAKHTREKGFSLGSFREAYVRRFPVAVVRQGGHVVAFANVWLSATREEMSPDLMRYESSAPHGVMEYLFVQLMLWGAAQGYRWFGLGMAPLSGFDARALAPRWSRMGAMLYRHGEHFYNFRGLRHYKEKFDPVWRPRYLASPGGLALPGVLTNVAALVSGGLLGVVSK
jgi:phosphatidylglycerol lysyltransferase